MWTSSQPITMPFHCDDYMVFRSPLSDFSTK